MQQAPEASAAEGWLTIAGCAQQLGVSVDTVRRRLKRGELEHRRVPTAHGFRWEVLLGAAAEPGPGLGSMHSNGRTTPGSTSAQAAEAPHLAALVEKLTQQNLELAGRLGFYQAQLQQAQETIKALQAPAPAISTAEVEKDPPRRPWWRWW